MTAQKKTFSNGPILNNRELNSIVDQEATRFMCGDNSGFEYYPTGHERMIVRHELMPSIPAGANPFNHDEYSMGTNLSRDIIIMHPGFDNKDDPRAMEWFYIVNIRTGQRVKINMQHVPSAEQYDAKKAEWERKYGNEA